MSSIRTRHIDGWNAELSKSELNTEIVSKLSDGWAKWKIFRIDLEASSSNAELAKSQLWVPNNRVNQVRSHIVF